MTLANMMTHADKAAMAAILNRTLNEYGFTLNHADINSCFWVPGTNPIKVTKEGIDFLMVELPERDVQALDVIALKIQMRLRWTELLQKSVSPVALIL